MANAHLDFPRLASVALTTFPRQGPAGTLGALLEETAHELLGGSGTNPAELPATPVNGNHYSNPSVDANYPSAPPSYSSRGRGHQASFGPYGASQFASSSQAQQPQILQNNHTPDHPAWQTSPVQYGQRYQSQYNQQQYGQSYQSPYNQPPLAYGHQPQYNQQQYGQSYQSRYNQTPYVSTAYRSRRLGLCAKITIAAGTVAVVASVVIGTLAATHHIKFNNHSGGASTPGVTLSTDPLAFPSLPFISNSTGSMTKMVAFVIDTASNGPGSAVYADMLGALLKSGTKATFAINGNGSSDVLADPNAQQALRDTIDQGHAIANQGLNHVGFDTLTSDKIFYQLSQNLVVLRDESVLGPNFNTHQVQPPFGRPLQDNSPNVGEAAIEITKFGVPVGWSIDPKSFDCPVGANVTCVTGPFTDLLDANRTGVILLNSDEISVRALPYMLQELSSRNLPIVTTDQMIGMRYGEKDAAAVMGKFNAAKFTNAQIMQAALEVGKENNDKGYPD